MADATLLYGQHAVRAALRYDPSRILEVWVEGQRRDGRGRRLREQLEALECPVHAVSRRELDRLADGAAHQGVVVRYQGSGPLGDKALISRLDELDDEPFLLVLDQVQDPHNLGACLRIADAAGVDAIIAPRDRAVGLTPAVHKVASGATHTVPLYQVTNLARCLKTLRERGVWLVGAADDAAQPIYQVDLSGPLALVVGAEQQGMRRLTREGCDTLAGIPMRGSVDSLNVSVATGICVFEARRQRDWA